MKPIKFFRDRIGSYILRGTTIVVVTEENFSQLYELQDSENQYFFSESRNGA